MKLGSIDTNKLRGLFDKVVGLQKEVVGSVINNDRLVDEGEAQQKKGTESLKALRQQAKAEAKEAKAEAYEAKQRTAQRVKENA
jgi:uncharacterized protein YjbJ (UPF0337 family)